MCLALSAVSSFKSPTSIPPTHPDVPSRVCDRPSRSLDPSWSSFERLPDSRSVRRLRPGAPEAAAMGPVPAHTAAVRLPSGDTCAPGSVFRAPGPGTRTQSRLSGFSVFLDTNPQEESWGQQSSRRAGWSWDLRRGPARAQGTTDLCIFRGRSHRHPVQQRHCTTRSFCSPLGLSSLTPHGPLCCSAAVVSGPRPCRCCLI